ncbi:MAG: hypothetical protein EH225_08030 [Calditrichaeota bacterium]|nr:hypothetical protein [Calditrichota bacterium]RQW02788.1 MAG: hypothetical protein EH225_08030 [Calditrichota bacterium]
MNRSKLYYFIFLSCFSLFIVCSSDNNERVILLNFPLNSLEEIIPSSALSLDKSVTWDGNGSMKCETMDPGSLSLLETGDIDIENSQLIYQAKVRTENLKGKTYLEMWCAFPGKGEYFSRGLNNTLSGNNNWQVLETPFYLKQGENPSNIRLNLFIEGTGTVWIDDIKLLKAPR